MTKRIFNWKHSKNKKYKGREHPDFDFLEGCKDCTVVWWNDHQYCLDMDKLKKLLGKEGDE